MEKMALIKEFVLDRNAKLNDCAYSMCENEPMSKHTTFRVGGPADLLVNIPNSNELAECMKYCKAEEIEFTVLGNGSNVLVSDKGIRGVVFETANPASQSSCSIICEDENANEVYVRAECGDMLCAVSRFARNNSLTGLEFAEGIPGTIGGALIMNAGAYDGEMKNVVVSAEILDSEFNIRTIRGEELGFGYRTSAIQQNGWYALSTIMRLHCGSEEEISAKMADFAARRKSKQPLEMPSAGSTFKRPVGYFAGKLIQDSGLTGYTVGGAQVSEKHCGFVVNKGNATATDILNLIRDVKKTVWEKQGVTLECEVRLLGEW